MEIVGRDVEQQAVIDFIDAAAAPSALVVAGDAGAGKTVLWVAAVERAVARGATVLVARPTESESSLSFIGLHDLLEPVLEAARDGLSAPQQRALDVALRRADPSDTPPDQAAIALAVLNGLRQLAARGSVLLAIDDEPWLDPATSGVLRSAVHRLRTENVRILVTRRTSATGGGIPEELDRPAARRIVLGPLPVGALHHLVRTRLGLSLPRPALIRLHEVTQGNPLYALELARALGSNVVAPDALDRGVPTDLDDLLRARLGGLSASTRRVIETAALASRPTPRLLSRALDVDERVVVAALDAAAGSGIVGRDQHPVAFSHPLLASAARRALPTGIRRDLHRRLAELVDDPEERAIHVAQAADGPDADVAAALESAARSALDRGAVSAAIDLQQRAVDRTPEQDRAARSRRVVQLAEIVFTAGDTTRAHQLLAEVAGSLTDPDVRAQAGLLLATIVWFDGDSRDAAAIAEDALRGTTDVGWQARLHSRLAWIYEHDIARGTEHAAAALRLLDPEREPALFAFALLNEAVGELYLGRAADHDAIARGHRLQEEARLWEFSTLPANWAKWMDDFDRARELTTLYLVRARSNGDESSVAQLLTYLAELELWTGHADRAASFVEEAVAIAEQTDQAAYLGAALARRAAIRAFTGDLDASRTDAVAALDTAQRTNSNSLAALARGALAAIALLEDQPDAVDRECTAATAALLEAGDVTQPAFRFHADHIEAVIALGDLDRAAELISRLEARGKLGPCRWALATAERSAAQLAAARGDPAAAQARIDAALEHHATLEMPLELGRTWLVAGQLQRRAGKRRVAAESFDRAASIFRAIGTPPWLARTLREVDRLGLRPSDGDALTPSEERIGRLAASGLTNREVAARLSISPKTVEANLARIYLKLGIHSRAELGGAFSASGGRDVVASRETDSGLP